MKKLSIFIASIILLVFSVSGFTEPVLVHFDEAGTGKTGLTATIDIIDVSDGSVDVNDGALTELAASGWYWHDFSGIDATKTYVWYADGSSSLCDAERYKKGAITLTTAKINAEILDCLNTDTYPEPGQGAPPLPATPIQMMQYPYKAWRNKTTMTALGTQSLFNDAGDTVDHKTTITTSGGTTTKAEFGTGP